MGMMERGAAFVAAKSKQFLSVPVVYYRGAVSVPLQATRAATTNEAADNDGMTTRIFNRDYLIEVDLTLGEPERGDQIVDDGQRYEVMPVGGQIWRWSDRGHNRRRVHCRWIQTES